MTKPKPTPCQHYFNQQGVCDDCGVKRESIPKVGEAKPKEYPPRAHIRPDHHLEIKRHDAIEYLSLIEHNALLADETARCIAIAAKQLEEKDAEIIRLDHALGCNVEALERATKEIEELKEQCRVLFINGQRNQEDAFNEGYYEEEIAELKERLKVAREALEYFIARCEQDPVKGMHPHGLIRSKRTYSMFKEALQKIDGKMTLEADTSILIEATCHRCNKLHKRHPVKGVAFPAYVCPECVAGNRKRG